MGVDDESSGHTSNYITADEGELTARLDQHAGEVELY